MKEAASLIAPCGMNCAICLGYLRERKRCHGCRHGDTDKLTSRARCVIRNCRHIETGESGFCYDCSKYPCARLKQLDKRYTTKYGMSMLENLQFIREHGLVAFIEREDDRWRCRKCGGTVCVHRGYCYRCRQEPDTPQTGIAGGPVML